MKRLIIQWLVSSINLGIYAISSSNPDPVKAAKTLSSEGHLPHVYKRGFMDPNILKLFLIVHDKSESQVEYS